MTRPIDEAAQPAQATETPEMRARHAAAHGAHLPGPVNVELARLRTRVEELSRALYLRDTRVRELEGALRDVCGPAARAAKVLG
jgi:hypothetical protein